MSVIVATAPAVKSPVAATSPSRAALLAREDALEHLRSLERFVQREFHKWPPQTDEGHREFCEQLYKRALACVGACAAAASLKPVGPT